MVYISKLTKRLAAGRTAVALVAALAACSTTDVVAASDETLPPEVTDVRVLPESVSLPVGRSVRLSADIRDNRGNPMSGQAITWSSSDATIATVDTAGSVQLVNTGTVEIRAAVRGKSARSLITSTPIPVASVRISPSSVSLQVGQQSTLVAATLGSTDEVLTGRTVTWSSGNNAVASVDASGRVTAVSSGSATVTAASEGILGVASVTVQAAPVAAPGTVSDLAVTAVNDTTATLRFTDAGDGVGGGARYVVRYALPPIAWATASNVARGTCVTPVSAASAGAVVSCTIRGLTPGTGYRFQVMAYRGTIGTDAVYGAVSNTASGTTTVPVPVVASVSVAPGTASILTGATAAFTATARDAAGNVIAGQTVAWSSTNNGVATVSAAGVATAIAAGTTTVRATIGGIAGNASLTVSAPVVAVASVAVAPGSASISTGATQTFSATPRDASGNALTGRSVTWSSTNTAVATVSAAGVATAVAAGSATIRATVEGIVGTSTLTVTAPVVTVASVDVTPNSRTISTGATLAFTATPRDAAGNAISGRTVTWSSTNGAVASVSAGGVASALAVGTTTIRATVSGVAGDAALSVTAPASTSGFTNEPAGFTTLGEWRNATGLDANGWYDDGNPNQWGSKTRVTSGYAGTPRIGGAAVIRSFYAGGVAGGYDPGRMQLNLPSGTDEIFFAAEVQFGHDYPMSTSSGGNKQMFVTFSGGGRYFLNLDDGQAQGKWGVYQQSTPLVQSNVDLVYGAWVKVEWYLKKDTGSGNGIMRLWIDGVLAVERTDLTFPSGSMTMAYDDGSNNGNHLVEGDVRTIRYEHGAAVDANRWMSVLRVSAPPR